ncbi:aromatic amino acid DMT transporter YddG [Pararobbsia silviterrae]|uniref:Drug/metabolite DMT transporter permease n=1 Tax=Pararobbsia silviterrae TaxID=1792498 RepID=A0A494YH65_9BURK|nr:aromatic amino acid DMT transporter YddG [Pararobbsia silviterrae]RKP59367.1 drug/metabolite DMT transporter permease [Pararobbsia silviterrae]
MQSKNKATWIGLIAILLWSTMVALIRGVSETMGATGGAALIYTAASACLCVTVGVPNLKTFPRRYLLWGSLLFVSYEVCLALSIGYAHSGRQAVEVAMVNYLWPTFTLIAAILFNGEKANLLVVPGFVLSLLGIGCVLGGSQGFDLADMAVNLRDNPLSYSLAFFGALIWATYCSVTKGMANGKNGVTFFFMLVAATLWVKFLLGGGDTMAFTARSVAYVICAGAAMGLGYAAWNIGILRGNVTVLAGASYFTPVLSSALSAALLHVPLSGAFWKGALMICAGSSLCWLSTQIGVGRQRKSLNVE